MKFLRLFFATLAIGLAGASTASAHDSYSFGINVDSGYPYYYAPPVVEYYPAPRVVYYSRPVTYYRTAPPIYYSPYAASFTYYGNGGSHHYGHDHGWNGGGQGHGHGHGHGSHGHSGGHHRR